ncbi:ATPase, histidine kinase-, DNA gyrase B (macronuclear) [Tetrahymena thermophila SB210]|uniref:ATPase, histidine kinase-, DNA gyrase B n=1 Tax=Tetrahymena thermophila (strain SB210) TaxID=312017 RepID=Q245A8_TETTS|nr:ATPase, histidine kinase-, DNA gyrase B [Tetrahymena thermophila SB210]EAS03329.1 ATPase, histidine kinase-, DNA gyrase B [Tetrahymena thermophila SB210]|eukprot:XP_001023574.1 ATPase, histidine kinase-, DNA gyrase B [Tetrahymena thermophila SB210]
MSFIAQNNASKSYNKHDQLNIINHQQQLEFQNQSSSPIVKLELENGQLLQNQNLLNKPDKYAFDCQINIKSQSFENSNIIELAHQNTDEKFSKLITRKGSQNNLESNKNSMTSYNQFQFFGNNINLGQHFQKPNKITKSLNKSKFSIQKKIAKLKTVGFQEIKKNSFLQVKKEFPLQMILESINLGVLCYDFNSKNVTYVNKQIQDIFNEKDSSEILNIMKTFRNYMKPNQKEFAKKFQTTRNLDLVPNELFQDLACISQRPKSNTDQQFQSIKFNASIQNMQNLASILNNEHGEFLDQNSSTIKNLQPQNQSESQLKQSFYSNQYLLKSQIDEIIQIIKNKIYNEQDLKFLKIKFLAAPKNISICKNSQNLYLKSSSFSLNQPQQKEKIIQITMAPILVKKIWQILFIIEDVTHFNQIKVLESLNKNKSLMLSQVSHEIRNPISCIIAMLEEIQSISKNSQNQIYDCTQSALQSSKLLLNLLNDLLDMSQIKAGKFKLVIEQFNLCQILQEIQQMMQPLAKNKQNTIILQVEEAIQNKVANFQSDKYRIRQILINLISNSIKYTYGGNIYITLTQERLDDRYFRISVRDEGVGIKQEFRQKLFQAFGKLDDTESQTKNNPQGVGLGLMISNTIAKNLKPDQQNLSQHAIFIPKNSSLYHLRSQITPTQQQQQSSYSYRSVGNKIDNRDSKQTIAPSYLSSFSIEEGLILNEEVQKGTEFYFLVYNFQQVELKQQQEVAQFSKSPCHNHKRTSVFSQIDNLQQEQLLYPFQKESYKNGSINNINQQIQERSQTAIESEPDSFDDNPQSYTSSFNDNQEKIKNNIKYIAEMCPQNEEIPIQSDKNSYLYIQDNQKYKVSLLLKEIQLQISDKQDVNIINQRSNDKYFFSKKQITQGMQDIIKKSSMRKKQYSTFFDTEINILIADDDQFSSFALKIKIASAFKQFNKNLALCFTTVYSGEECIRELVKTQKCYQFLFIDAQMPEIDGYESIRQIDQLNLRNNQLLEKETKEKQIFSQLQIIMCSGFQKEEAKLNIYRIKYYLQKPVEDNQILEIIKNIFIENHLELPQEVQNKNQTK